MYYGPTQSVKARYLLAGRPFQIDDSNHNVWCNLHITPALEGVMVEVHSLEEVAHWVKRQHLWSAPDPMEPRVASLIVALGKNPWPCTLRLARVLVALDQKLCSLTEAMNSAKEHLREKKDCRQLIIT